MNYLRSSGNELATVQISAFYIAVLSNNSFICKYNIFFRKYELSVVILYNRQAKKKIIHPIHGLYVLGVSSLVILFCLCLGNGICFYLLSLFYG